VPNLKYLGIILESKLSFKDHIIYTAEKCSKLIFALARSAKLNWGAGLCGTENYTCAILPLLLYGAPISINAIKKVSYKQKIIRVQRLINIRIAKAYRTVSNEALCMITGLTPIDIKIEEVASLFQITKGRTKEELPFDLDTRIKHWPHHAFSISLLKQLNDEDNDLEIFTDGSKTKQGVGAGVAIYRRGTHTRSLKYRLHDKCTNNQAEQMAILKSLPHVTKEHSPNKTVTIYTDSQMTLNSLTN